MVSSSQGGVLHHMVPIEGSAVCGVHPSPPFLILGVAARGVVLLLTMPCWAPSHAGRASKFSPHTISAPALEQVCPCDSLQTSVCPVDNSIYADVKPTLLILLVVTIIRGRELMMISLSQQHSTQTKRDKQKMTKPLSIYAVCANG